MNIDLAAVLTKFQNISPGAFIKLDISIEGRSVGILVEDGHGNQGIVTFPATPAPQHPIAWHQQGGISHRTLIHFPTALRRPALPCQVLQRACPWSAWGTRRSSQVNKIGIIVNTSTSIRAKPKRWL
ncbi:hypothetical protein CV770_31785 [Bradyrhizobium sp. AC87j1]|uniref:hypothetical protein n=1 Tax=Bradyrhizobium sp. AC87j1 TaxID=2055894 RepID=UPI000CEB84B2|nr:hypothetical protein [Bradyrhizobium sp. AC87j1]PPQ15416.1 hypothetical protein CV770_31785 [Bradyrhizobium sp. AC87j1]